MQDGAQIRRRKRLSNVSVLSGVSLMAVALLISSARLVPAVITSAGAVVGFALLMYGVHVGWLVFYDKEPDGPAS